MNADYRPDPHRPIRKRARHLSAASYELIMPVWVVLSLCLVFGCIHKNEIKYLSAAEIQGSIIGNSLKEAKTGRWKEDYLAIGGSKLDGIIRGHEGAPDGPYGGTWSLRENLMCVSYSSDLSKTTCYQFARGNGHSILWFDEAGELTYETELIESNQSGDVDSELMQSTFRQETVAFRHGDNLLVGDLRLPNGPAPYPLVVYVEGSGPASRHRHSPWPLRAIPDEFLYRGFGTFTWSRAGVDESTGDYLKQSMSDRAEEVTTAMAHLAERADIDRDRIGLFGVSQAGWVMPSVPALRNPAFVIAVSCPGQSSIEHEMYPVEKELASTGISEAERTDAREHIRTLLNMFRIGMDYEEYLLRHEEWLAEAKTRSWYATVESKLADRFTLGWIFSTIDREWFEFVAAAFANDAPPELENFRMPVLAIFGTNDSRVDPNIGAMMYEGIPLANGNYDVTVEVFEGADHSIMLPDSEGYLEFAPGFLTTMGEWLSAHR